MIELRGGTVVDADGARRADVAIEGERIVAVGTDLEVDPDRTVDVTDRYVAPGLIDAHVHLAFDARPDVSTYRDGSTYDGAYRAAANLRAALEAGVTTVRDLGSWGSLAIDASRAVADGVVEGPRVVAAGEAIAMTGGHGHWFSREADGPAETRRAAREQLKRGADVLKCIATGGVLTGGSRTGAPELAPAELEAVVDVGRTKGVPTAAHAHGREGIVNAVCAGVDSVEHATFMDREAADLMATRGTYWVPTARALREIVDAGTDGGIPEQAVEKAVEAGAAFEEAFEHALAADVPVAMGTDAGTPFNDFAGIAEELALLVEYGLSPRAALEAATVGGADLLGLEDVGLVEAEFRADLVVLESNPLSDAAAWRAPTSVFAAGRRVR